LDDRAPSFRENPSIAFSPRDIVVHEGGGESASGAIMARLLLTYPPSSNGPYCPSKSRKGWKAWMKTPLQDHATKCLGDFLVASSLSMTKMQKLREAASQDALQIKELKHRETALYLEVSNLCQTDKETKKLLFRKSQEALGAHAKVLALRTKIIGL